MNKEIAMLTRAALAGLLILTAASAQTPSAATSSRAGAGGPAQPVFVPSPEIHPDRRVTFRLQAPQVSSVTVQGEFASGAQAMQKDEKGLWSLTVGPLAPEID